MASFTSLALACSVVADNSDIAKMPLRQGSVDVIHKGKVIGESSPKVLKLNSFAGGDLLRATHYMGKLGESDINFKRVSKLPSVEKILNCENLQEFVNLLGPITSSNERISNLLIIGEDEYRYDRWRLASPKNSKISTLDVYVVSFRKKPQKIAKRDKLEYWKLEDIEISNSTLK